MNTLGEIWIQLFENGSFGFILLLLVNQMVYFVLLSSKSTRSEKYKFAVDNEVKYLKRTANFFSVSIFFFLFSEISSSLGVLGGSMLFIFVALMAFMFSFMIAYGFNMYLQFYYPFVLEKRLKSIRFSKLKSSSGHYMKLLNELEEDEFMSDEMIALEDASEADFDIWVDEVSDEKIIHKYDISDKALVCPACNFRTLKERKEKVLKDASEFEEGLVEKFYQCTYCNHKESRQLKLISWSKKRELENI
jgi:DNA-directed RNA polymerase subunit RPC12/RpoP